MEHVLIVHGDDGLDEITVSAETVVCELKNNQIHEYKISPKDFGINISPFEEIIAYSSEQSLMLVKEAFLGKNSAVQDMIALNSGAALYVADIVKSISDGVEMAFELMNNGKAANKLAAYVKTSKNI